jgi:hypothetical protein
MRLVLPRSVDRSAIVGRRTNAEPGMPGAWATAILFAIPQPEFCCVLCVPCVSSLTQDGPLNRGFARRRGGRVAEGGGLLNRYTV